jgi:hypothetical protein
MVKSVLLTKCDSGSIICKSKVLFWCVLCASRNILQYNDLLLYVISIILMFFSFHPSSIQPLVRFSRNQSPVRRPVWLWYAASWTSS